MQSRPGDRTHGPPRKRSCRYVCRRPHLRPRRRPERGIDSRGTQPSRVKRSQEQDHAGRTPPAIRAQRGSGPVRHADLWMVERPPPGAILYRFCICSCEPCRRSNPHQRRIAVKARHAPRLCRPGSPRASPPSPGRPCRSCVWSPAPGRSHRHP
uniref:Uncharacterized protein n=1 Tax=uncultured marine virus TaxID=186617 RepID=A0A0F7L546_9VIRU|nr:hypothetical protein [uncultured marine virus]